MTHNDALEKLEMTPRPLVMAIFHCRLQQGRYRKESLIRHCRAAATAHKRHFKCLVDQYQNLGAIKPQFASPHFDEKYLM